MSTTRTYDAAAAAQLQTIYSTPDIAATRIATFRAANPKSGENALDVGCGPGYMLHDLAVAVGAGGYAVGIDVNEPMLTLARQRCANLDNVRLKKANAGSLPVEDGTIDIACAMQVYSYVKELDRALSELGRVLKLGGRAIILDTDFSGVVWESRNRERMRKILTAYDKHVTWPDLPRILPHRLQVAGFKLERCEMVPILTLNYHPNTYVFGLSRIIHRFSIEKAGIPIEDADAWLIEFENLEREGAFLFAMNRFLFTAIWR